MTHFALSLSLVLAISGQSCLDMFKASPTNPTTGTSAFAGSWTSVAASTVQETCTSFRWTVADISSTGASGTWSAVCWGNVPINGTASGTLGQNKLTWTATGNGTTPSGASCPVALSGTVTLEGTQLRIPYSGTTCFGPVAGTEILRKPS